MVVEQPLGRRSVERLKDHRINLTRFVEKAVLIQRDGLHVMRFGVEAIEFSPLRFFIEHSCSAVELAIWEGTGW